MQPIKPKFFSITAGVSVCLCANVLVISEHSNPDKIARHVGPLAAVVDSTTIVCLTPNRNVDLKYIEVPSLGVRLLGICLMFFVALREVLRNDYDLVVSFSLFPYGLYALAIGSITRTPTHLGILGADLDVHAHAWYGWLPRTVFRQFGSISVLGSNHREQLIEYGVHAENVFVLTNAIDTGVYHPNARTNPTYDFVWCGRLAPEKNPLLFIKSIHELRERGYEPRAVLLGTGKLEEEVNAAVEKYDLADTIRRPGWINEPAEYYAKSRVFVLTSRREALGLALLESMAMGLPCVAPVVGNIPDIAEHGRNTLLVEESNPEAFADAMQRLLTEDDLRERLGENAVRIGQSYSFEKAREDWREIVEHTRR